MVSARVCESKTSSFLWHCLTVQRIGENDAELHLMAFCISWRCSTLSLRTLGPSRPIRYDDTIGELASIALLDDSDTETSWFSAFLDETFLAHLQLLLYHMASTQQDIEHAVLSSEWQSGGTVEFRWKDLSETACETIVLGALQSCTLARGGSVARRR